MPPPELLEADHVWLRRARVADAADLFASYASDPSATLYLSWPTRRTVGEVEGWLVPHVAGWDEGREYRWVVTDQPQSSAFGTVSLRRTGEGFDLGYALATARSGEGIATSAVRAVLGWVDAAFGGATVSARTDPDNVASAKVLLKVGFGEVGREVAVSQRPNLGTEPRDTLIYKRPPTR